MTERDQFVTVVVPVFRSPGTIRELSLGIARAMHTYGMDWELLLVMDGDGQELWQQSTNAVPAGLPIRAVRLSRNFGQHRAIRQGMHMARAGYVVTMDCDLQDPPDVLPRVLAGLLVDQVDVVFTRRLGAYDTWSRSALRGLFSGTLAATTGLNFEQSLGPVIGMSPRACHYVKAFREDAHLLHILTWLALPHVVVDYERRTRTVGTSSYSLSKRIRHGVRGLAFSSSRVMSVTFVACFVAAFFSMLGLIALAASIIHGTPPNGWLSLISVAVLGFALTGMLLAVVGGLLLEVLSIVRSRPFAVVADEWPRS